MWSVCWYLIGSPSITSFVLKQWTLFHWYQYDQGKTKSFSFIQAYHHRSLISLRFAFAKGRFMRKFWIANVDMNIIRKNLEMYRNWDPTVEDMARKYVFLIFACCFITCSIAKHHLRHKAKVVPTLKLNSGKIQNPNSLQQNEIKTGKLDAVKIQTSNFVPQTDRRSQKPENSTMHLRSALDVLAPEDGVKSGMEFRLPLLSKPVPEKFHSEAPRSSGQSSFNDSRNDVVFEVIDIDPYSGTKSRFNRRFFILTGLYAASGLVGIVVTYCVAKLIIKRRKRHSQYMLLTKSDMEYHRGGGGI